MLVTFPFDFVSTAQIAILKVSGQVSRITYRSDACHSTRDISCANLYYYH